MHPIQWQAPEPLWARFGATADVAVTAPDQFRPAILRFATDDFMEQMIGTLTHDPAQIGSFLARPETWRTPPVADEPDKSRHAAMPRIVQALARSLKLKRAKTPLQAVEATASVEEKKQERSLPLKLYQPAHQRYYLISASLVCRMAGLPERTVVRGGSEQTGFVLRRLLPAEANSKNDADLTEFAFVKDAQGARWQRVSASGDKAGLVADEELLPLFPLNYRDAIEHTRTLWTGLVPVGRREEYMGATIDRSAVALSMAQAQRQSLQPSAAFGMASSITARMTQFKMEVAEPWKNLVRAVYKAKATLQESKDSGLSNADLQKRIRTLNLQWQMQSWLILLDFADYLAAYLLDVWAAIETGTSIDTLKPQSRMLYNWLGNSRMSQDLIRAIPGKAPSGSLREALKAVRTPSVRAGLEGTEKLYGSGNLADSEWPGFHFLLAGIGWLTQAGNAFVMQVDGAFKALSSLAKPTSSEVENEVPKNPVVGMDDDMARGMVEAEELDRLTALVARALERRPETDAPAPPFALQLIKALESTQDDAGWFVIRYVHINRDCGPLHPPTLSEPTQRFQLASFFDYDAPARPIRIALPMDTTPAGLRKYKKNTAFVISDVLCGQIQRAKGLGLGDLVRSVLPWPFHKELNVGDGGPCNNGLGKNIGMICSLSIPIITICALILLMIIVSLLDFIFRWIPSFIMCFPVPGLKGKRGGNE